MASRISRYISALLLSALAAHAAAQEPAAPAADTLQTAVEAVQKAVKEKREKRIYFINGAAVGADLAGLGMRLLGSDWHSMEVLGRINILDKYFPTAELGLGEADHEGRDIDNRFKVRAPYFRVGADYNFNKRHNGNRMMAGLRYGFSAYTYDFTSPVPLTDPVWGEAQPLQRTDLDGRCHWAELVFGLETRLWNIVHLGWDIRLKAKISQKKSPDGAPWYIPGYGKTASSTAWGGSFKLLFDI